MSEPLLSICIPTFNRAALLKEAFDSILPQLAGSVKDQVEIVISDNASSDHTGALVAAWQKVPDLKLKYARNATNLGFDGNILKVVALASGRYCWILSDDDLMAPGALRLILAELNGAEKIDLFLCEKNDFLLTPDRPMRFRRIMKFSGGVVFDFRDKRRTDAYFRLNKRLIAYCNFLSNIVFSREKWERVGSKAEFVGSQYVHLYVFQTMLWDREPGVLKYLPLILVRRRWGNDGLYDAEQRLVVDVNSYHRIAVAVFRDRRRVWQIDDLVIRNDAFSWAVRLKVQQPGRFWRETIPFLFLAYWDHSLFWLKIVPLLFVPATLIKFLRWGYRVTIKGEPLGWRDIW